MITKQKVKNGRGRKQKNGKLLTKIFGIAEEFADIQRSMFSNT